MAGVLRSLLAPALKKLADKGENVPLDSLINRLKREGVSDSELSPFTDALSNEADNPESFLRQPDITTRTKKGNPAFTPKGLEEIQELQPTFKTIEETQYDRDQLDFERLEDQTESEVILGQLDELQRKKQEREELLTRGLEGGENLDPDELDKIQLEADMLQEEIQELDNIYGQSLVREEEPPEYKFDEFYKGITPADVNDDTYGISVVRDPRDNTTGQSAHLDYLGRENYSYHMRYDTEEEALRVFEMQRDIINPDEWNSDNYKQAASPSLLPLEFSPESLKIIQDQIDKIDGLYTNPDVPPQNFLNTKENEIKKLNNLWDELTGSEIIKLDSYKNLINRSLVKADNEGLNKVKFLINPEGRTARRVARSEAIQRHYSTVVANQIRKTAKKIGSSAIMDKKGYLVVALPAAGFTLPLYGEESKEASFIATAASKGMDRNEAKEMVNDRVSEFPFPVDKESNRENFNIGGRVLSSLKRKAS